MTQVGVDPFGQGDTRRWRRPRDPLRDVFLLAGRLVPMLYSLYVCVSQRRPSPWTYLVYSEGHTGTAALEASLRRADCLPCFVARMLNPERIKRKRPYPMGVLEMYYRHFIEGRRPLRILSMVRNPLDQAVSRFFQNLRRQYDPDMPMDEVVDMFRLFYRKQPEDWISVDMNAVLDTDVYSAAFDPEEGCLTIEGGWYRLLLLRLELENQRKEEAIASFLGLDSFTWDHTVNASTGNVYSSHYDRFKRDVAMDSDIIDRLLSLRYARHFYTDRELAEYRDRWARPRNG